MTNKILIPLRIVKVVSSNLLWTGEPLWVQLRDSGRGYSPVCPEGSTTCCALGAVAQVGDGSSVLTLLCAKEPVKTVGKDQTFSSFPSKLWRGFLGMFFPLLSPPVLQLLSPSQPTWGSAPWPRDARLSGCNSTGQDKLQKDSPLRKSIHGNWRKPISCETVPSLSNNSGVQWEPHCLSGKSKGGPPKVYHSGLRLFLGEVILKDKFLSQCASDSG